jgi:palmitoyltransferase
MLAWLNNCVGHFNRRYFLMFMVYIEISMIFLMIFGIEIAYKELWLYYMPPEDHQGVYGFPVQVNTSLPQVFVFFSSI